MAIALAPSISHATDTKLEAMPAQLETRFPLSALPTRLRDGFGVLLDPDKGYRLARQGTSGIACLVERTGWELADFRNDIYIPLCYDAAGTSTGGALAPRSWFGRAAAPRFALATLWHHRAFLPVVRGDVFSWESQA
jgi:hypothetical protein